MSVQHVVIQARSDFHGQKGCEYEDIQIGNYTDPRLCMGYFRTYKEKNYCLDPSWWGNNNFGPDYFQSYIVCCDKSKSSCYGINIFALNTIFTQYDKKFH